MPRSTTAMALRSSGRFVRCTAFSGSSRSSVANLLPRSVVTTKLASRVKTSITTRPYFVFPRVFWLKSMRSACSRSLGSAADLPSAHGRGACTCRPTSAFSASPHGLRHVEVALPRESVQLPRVPHVASRRPGPPAPPFKIKVPWTQTGLNTVFFPTCCPKKRLPQGSADARRPEDTSLLPQKGA